MQFSFGTTVALMYFNFQISCEEINGEERQYLCFISNYVSPPGQSVPGAPSEVCTMYKFLCENK